MRLQVDWFSSPSVAYYRTKLAPLPSPCKGCQPKRRSLRKSVLGWWGTLSQAQLERWSLLKFSFFYGGRLLQVLSLGCSKSWGCSMCCLHPLTIFEAAVSACTCFWSSSSKLQIEILLSGKSRCRIAYPWQDPHHLE